MTKLIGQRLINSNSITEKELNLALTRQRMQGGRLGHNLVALGFIRPEEMDHLFHPVPKQPGSYMETGLSEIFINELMLKHSLDMVEFTIQDMGAALRLPLPLINTSTDTLRRERLIEVRGATQLAKLSYRFCLTEAGRNKAVNLKEISRYTGPAPVPYNEYKQMVEMQTVKSITVDENAIRQAFADITINGGLMGRIGPAVSSGRAIFLYGPPGNGKTTIAEAIGRLLPGEIYIPHAIIADGEIITIFDRESHIPVEETEEAPDVDRRWIKIRRPVIMVGGEMTLKGLDLDYNRVANFYVAPLQVKANNGLFIIDDFGRQQIKPQALLNRWIVPLERRTDFLSFHTGMKIEIPFDQLVIFATNLDPGTLVDEAFLRRIRYKIKIDHPSLSEYRAIFMKVCDSNGIEFREEVFDYLVTDLYGGNNVKFNSCHCRDLLDNIIDEAHYQGIKPEISRSTITSSWDSYYVKL